ncbi:MAG: DUF2752 domain-containing protein [Lachnospiraceae bacterium]|nr:DUF2752 domain-containing protein [Lachnospiraceae bacterium]
MKSCWKENLREDFMLIKACLTKSNIIFGACLAFILFMMLIFDLDCPILHITGISCPGCGMTRAYLRLLHFQIREAGFYHPLWWAPPFVPIFWLLYKRGKVSHKVHQIFLYLFAGLFLVTYLIRILFFRSMVIRFSPKSGVIYQVLSHVFSFL